MKRLILPLLCLFVLASSSFAWMTLPVVGGGGGGPCGSCEVGFDSGDPGGTWTSDGDYGNTTPAMCGAQNVRLDAAESIVYDPDYGATEMYFRYAYHFADDIDLDEPDMLRVLNAGGGAISNVGFTSTNYISCLSKNGTSDDSGGIFTASAGETYYITVYAASASDGVSTDGVTTAWVSIDGAWVQACSSTDGDDDASIDRFNFTNKQNGTGIEWGYFDCFSDSATVFGDLP